MLLLAEQQAEMEAVQKEVVRWKAEEASRPKKVKVSKEAQPIPADEKEKAAPPEAASTDAEAKIDFKAYVDVPTMADIERLIIEKKKQTLLAKYASGDLQKQSLESSDLLG